MTTQGDIEYINDDVLGKLEVASIQEKPTQHHLR
jgi:hypothetical protein